MNKIVPNLWFDSQAEEAANFYVSVFSRIGRSHGRTAVGRVTRYGPAASKAAGRPEGSVLTVDFELHGQRYVALNGGPLFPFTEAVSLMVECDDQAEIDALWDALIADGGSESMCGWLKDKYGFSWQIVPAELDRMMNDPDPARSERVAEALFQMRKLDLLTLKRAYEGR